MPSKKEELAVITTAKELCSYIMKVTQKSPKHFRYTYVTRLQNIALSVIEDMFMANSVFVEKGDFSAYRERVTLQRKALAELRLLAYFSMLAAEDECILFKQYENIAKLSENCMNLLGAWITSDRKRFR